MTALNYLMVRTAFASGGSSFMPTAATDIAEQVNNLYSFLLWISAVSCFILIGGMIYFVLKYKRKTDNDKTAYITHNTFLEFLWSFIPLVLFLVVFGWGWHIYHQMKSIKTVGHKEDQDKCRQEYLEKMGWCCYVLWESDVMTTPSNTVKRLVSICG